MKSSYSVPQGIGGGLSKDDLQWAADQFPGFRPIEWLGEAGEWGYSVTAYYAYKCVGGYAVIEENHCSCNGFSDGGGSLEGLYKTKQEMLDHLSAETDSYAKEYKQKLRAIILSGKAETAKF